MGRYTTTVLPAGFHAFSRFLIVKHIFSPPKLRLKTESMEFVGRIPPEVKDSLGAVEHLLLALRDAISVASVRKAHETSLLGQVEELAESVRVLNSAWTLHTQEQTEARRDAAKAIQARDERVSSSKAEVERLESRLRDNERALRDAESRLEKLAIDADAHAMAAAARERSAAEAYHTQLLRDARLSVEVAVEAERARLMAAHKAALDAVLASAEGENATRMKAAQEALRSADAVRQAAVAAAADADRRAAAASADAELERHRSADLRRQLDRCQGELAAALGQAAEWKERAGQLDKMVSCLRGSRSRRPMHGLWACASVGFIRLHWQLTTFQSCCTRASAPLLSRLACSCRFSSRGFAAELDAARARRVHSNS